MVDHSPKKKLQKQARKNVSSKLKIVTKGCRKNHWNKWKDAHFCHSLISYHIPKSLPVDDIASNAE